MVIPVAGMAFATTLTVHVFCCPPSTVVQVMTAVPTAFPVTTPPEDTDATALFDEAQVTFLFVALLGLTVSFIDMVFPTPMLAELKGKYRLVTAIGGGVTATLHVAEKLPSAVLQVIVACPTAVPVTTPVEETVATLLFEELHVTDLFVALLGEMVLARLTVLPTLTDVLVGDTLTPVTATVCGVTVTPIVAVYPPSTVVHLIGAVPTARPVTWPVEDTVATSGLSDSHVTDLFAALPGETLAVRLTVFPTSTDEEDGEMVTPVTRITAAETVTPVCAT